MKWSESEIKRICHELAGIGSALIFGCGNHGCVIKKPTGQGTNGSCACTRNKIAGRLQAIVRDIENGSTDLK